MKRDKKSKMASAKRAPDLADHLAAAIDDQNSGRRVGAVGAVLRDATQTLRTDALAAHERGDHVAREISKGVDHIISTLFALNADENKLDLAVCAVGGYGRGLLAPYSDIDLLFIHGPDEGSNFRINLDAMLYPLWDSGLKIAHAAHTPDSAAAFAKSDIIGRTSYLDARFLCGDRGLWKNFSSQYDRLRRRTVNEFVAAKLEEQHMRHTRAQEAQYAVEPNLKEGKGGLRDLQTIRWLHRYVFGEDFDAKGSSSVLVEPHERAVLRKMERFLWSVRIRLHEIRGRADEAITFEVQPDLAARLGYADREQTAAAERLMKHYFLNTMEVGLLGRMQFARLEEMRAKRAPTMFRKLPSVLLQDEAGAKPNIRLTKSRLDFTSASKANQDPRDFFRLFRALSKRPKLKIHPRALKLIGDNLGLVDSTARRDPEIGALFAGILTEKGDPARVLRLMTEVRLLGKYIPAYGSIVGQIDYGLYRRFTLDEHVLRSIGFLNDIRGGGLRAKHPITTNILSTTRDPFPYLLAVLLHELRFALGDQSIAARERRVAQIARRLGADKETSGLIGWSVIRFRMMLEVATRRNLADEHTIERFAVAVGRQERLDMVLVLCVCHMRHVGLRSWNELIRRQLTAVYDATSAYLAGGRSALKEYIQDKEENAAKYVRQDLAHWPHDEREIFISSMTKGMLLSADHSILVRFAQLTRAARQDGRIAAVTVAQRAGDLEALVYAENRPGLLSDLAGATASIGLGVRAVQVETMEGGMAADYFIIQSPDGTPLIESAQAERVHKALLAAASEPSSALKVFKRRIGDRRGLFDVPPKVRVEMGAADNIAVVEAEGLNRPGLLHELTAALHELSYSIRSAHIATYGERAVDTFYIETTDGAPLTGSRPRKMIERKLLQALSAGVAA